MNEFIKKIQQRSVHVGVMGLGYVGLPLAVAFAEAGYRVAGLDVDPRRVDRVRAGESYVGDIDDGRLAAAVGSGRLAATDEVAVLANLDAVLICVPTPLSKTKDPDVSYVLAAAEQVAACFHPGMLIIMESTTYPGTSEEILLPRLKANGGQAGKDFFLAYSPERIDPGNDTYSLANTPKIVGGYTPTCGEVAAALYRTIVDDVHVVSSCRAAEMVKLLENTFRAVNIALVNEVAMMCERLEIDTWEVIEAAATKPFGFMPFYPGPGLGGHCIPVDPHYLTWKVRTLDYKARLVELAGEINAAMPEHVVRKIADALNDRKKSVNGARILILGVAYKPNVDDVRESPAIDIMRLLAASGAQVEYSDPHVPLLSEGFDPPLTSVDGLPSVCKEYDCVVVCTNHRAFDWPDLIKAASILIDTRNVTAGNEGPHIVRL
ncbi:MAG: nucleotide sugar dehydrogenase [Acidobacteriota bacterium]